MDDSPLQMGITTKAISDRMSEMDMECNRGALLVKRLGLRCTGESLKLACVMGKEQYKVGR